jgi:hypothetical protein
VRNRLSACSGYLHEVEEKLIELQSLTVDDPEESARVSEALTFVHEAPKSDFRCTDDG